MNIYELEKQVPGTLKAEKHSHNTRGHVFIWVDDGYDGCIDVHCGERSLLDAALLVHKSNHFMEALEAVKDSLNGCYNCEYEMRGECNGQAPVSEPCLKRKYVLDLISKLEEVKEGK